MFSRSLARILQKRLGEQVYFGTWLKEKPREYWHRGDDYSLGVDLQLGKWWEEKGGEIAVNLRCGHKWAVSTSRPTVDGFDFDSCRLGPTPNQDYWWKIATDDDVEVFSAELASLLCTQAIPWFDQVSTKPGFLNWFSSIYPESSCLPYVLEVHGASALRKSVCHWLSSAPRGIEKQLGWLVEVGVLSTDTASQLSKASIQSAETYRSRLSTILKEVEQSTTSHIN